MHRRAMVLAFLPAALEVLAFPFVKCRSSKAFRSMCRRHEYACVSCLWKSCVVLSCAGLCCVVLSDCNNSGSRNEMCLVLGMLCSRSWSCPSHEATFSRACALMDMTCFLFEFRSRAAKWVCVLFTKSPGIVAEPLCLTKKLACYTNHACLSKWVYGCVSACVGVFVYVYVCVWL